MVTGLYFLIVIAMPLGLGCYVLFHGLPRTRRCPMCGDDTLRIRSRLHRLTSRLVRSEDLQRRWCMRCGWRGTARLPRIGLEETGARSPAGLGRSRPPGGDRLDLRWIELDGLAWRVLIECRSSEEGWVAQLVFVGPGGRSWADDEPIAGETAAAVISQAFGLSEQALTGRLRRVLH